jgi:hypothetical protein
VREMLQTMLVLTKMEAGNNAFVILSDSLNKEEHVDQNCYNHFFNLQDYGGLAIAFNAHL